MITELVRYVYYRFAHAVRNCNLMGRQLYDLYAKLYLMLLLISNILVILSIVLYIGFDISSNQIWDVLFDKYKFPWIFLILIVVIDLFISCFVKGDIHFYKQLDKKYKNEKKRVLKGWLIAIYCVLSFALLVMSWFFLEN